MLAVVRRVHVLVEVQPVDLKLRRYHDPVSIAQEQNHWAPSMGSHWLYENSIDHDLATICRGYANIKSGNIRRGAGLRL